MFRDLSNEGLRLLNESKGYVSLTSEPHFNASSLPFYAKPAGDSTSEVFLENIVEGYKYRGFCNRKIVLAAAGIPKQVELSPADFRNFQRGNFVEWLECSHIASAWEQVDTQKAVYQRDYKGDPPAQLNIPKSNCYGLPVTGRCDLLLYKGDSLYAIGELKSPRTASFDWIDGRKRKTGEGFKVGYARPQTYYLAQLGWYMFQLKPKIGFNLIVSGGDSQFNEWLVYLDWEGASPVLLRAESTLTSEQLQIEWWRIERGVKEATEHVKNICREKEKKDWESNIPDLVQMVPENLVFDQYPCAKGGYMCPYYPYCWREKYENR